MRPLPIRWRLTFWYAGVTGLALVAVAVAMWTLMARGITRAADDRIESHRQGLERFIVGLEAGLSLDERQEEYREYGDVSLSDALFEVTRAGDVLIVPPVPGWIPVATVARTQPESTLELTLAGEPYRIRAIAMHEPDGDYSAVIAVPLGSAYAALGHVRRTMFWLMPLMTIVAAIAGYAVSARALRPVDELTSAAGAIDVTHLGTRLRMPSAHDELQRLAATFNQMLDRLEAGVSEIASFTSEASHELRTPVAVIRTTAELALRRARTVDEYQASLREIVSHSTQMSHLVASLLALARTDAGVEQAPMARINLAAIARDEVDAVVANNPPVKVTANNPLDAWIVGDALHARRLVAILVDNAVKYTPAGGHVSVEIRTNDQHAQLIVEDDGAGIENDHREKLFARFYRTPAARASGIEGSGLGLSIAHAIANRFGGTIEIRSPAGGANSRPGTRVTVTFPGAAPSRSS